MEKSSQLVHSGEVIKISKGKAQKVTLFLFDHQLVFCKKVFYMIEGPDIVYTRVDAIFYGIFSLVNTWRPPRVFTTNVNPCIF